MINFKFILITLFVGLFLSPSCKAMDYEKQPLSKPKQSSKGYENFAKITSNHPKSGTVYLSIGYCELDETPTDNFFGGFAFSSTKKLDIHVTPGVTVNVPYNDFLKDMTKAKGLTHLTFVADGTTLEEPQILTDQPIIGYKDTFYTIILDKFGRFDAKFETLKNDNESQVTSGQKPAFSSIDS